MGLETFPQEPKIDQEKLLTDQPVINGHEPLPEESGFASAEAIAAVQARAQEAVAESIEARGRLEAKILHDAAETQTLIESLGSIEAVESYIDQLIAQKKGELGTLKTGSAKSEIELINRAYQVYQNRPRRTVHVTERPTVG